MATKIIKNLVVMTEFPSSQSEEGNSVFLSIDMFHSVVFLSKFLKQME